MIRGITLVLMILTLSSCGSSGSSSSAAAPAPAAPAITQQQASGAELAATKSDLEACESQIFGQLFYVEDESQFYYCAQKTSQWTAINLQGAKGNTGATGSTGQNSQDNEPGEWVDPVTGYLWIIGQTALPNQVINTDFCGSGTQFPTQDELETAFAHGMQIKFQTYLDNETYKIFIVGETSTTVSLATGESNSGSAGEVTPYTLDPSNTVLQTSAYTLCIKQ